MAQGMGFRLVKHRWYHSIYDRIFPFQQPVGACLGKVVYSLFITKDSKIVAGAAKVIGDIDARYIKNIDRQNYGQGT